MTATINTEATVARARQLLHTAADASKQLEETVAELVAMRAWDVLGYKDFSEMWERENGFECPTYAKVLAVQALEDQEGRNTRTGAPFSRSGPNGHTVSSIAKAVGIATQSDGRGGEISGFVTRARRQLDAGVPADKVITGSHAGAISRNIDQYGTRARAKPRRLGKTPDESVQACVYLPRRDDDEIADIARNADVPKAEIYRQAVAEYLMRHRESRPGVAS